MLEMPIEVAIGKKAATETASGSSCGGEAINWATGKKAARKESRLSETPPGSSARGEGDAFKSQKLADGDKAEAGKGKKMIKVSQKYIDRLLEEEAAGGPRIPNFDRFLNRKGPRAHLIQAQVAHGSAILAGIRANKARILEQYHRLGYALDEVDESFIEEEEE